MGAIDLLFQQLPAFALTTVRISGLFLIAPVFGQKSIPPLARVWMILLLAFLLLPVVSGDQVRESDLLHLTVLAVREAAVGLTLGFIVALFLGSAQFAGKLAGVHIGFGLATVLDPITEEQGTLIDQLHGLMVLVLFLTLGGHRFLLLALGTSFDLIPLGTAVLPPSIGEGILRLFVEVVILGIQIAVPVMASVFLTEATIGILSRGAPQFNIFSIGLPLRIGVGSIVLASTMPVTMKLMRNFILRLPDELSSLLYQLSAM